MTYAVLSDIHAHAFTLFAKTGADGVNTRLRTILDEMERAAAGLVLAGGDKMIIAGDIMHARGQIDPEVLNPLRTTIEKILAQGIDILAIPGNHDLKSAETQELSSSIQNLAQISPSGGIFRVFNEPTIVPFTLANSSATWGVGFVPWRNTKEQLLDDLKKLAASCHSPSFVDVFIHAGIDGVLSNTPAHGLTHVELASFGFRRVFAGHYHNHKDFGNGVVSIGATTHHNWGDVGTKAGFLLVDESTGAFRFERSQAPHFIDISGMSEFDITMTAPGNYCRVRGAPMTEQEIKDLRAELHKLGAIGVSIEVPPVTQTARVQRPGTGMTIAQSIEAYVKSAPPVSAVDPAEVVRRSIQVLNDSQAVVS